MIIEFADPGLDWTPYAITGAILGIIMLVPLVAGALHVRRRGRSEAGYVAASGLMIALFWLILGIGGGATVTATITHDSRVEASLYEALDEKGFVGIEIEYVKSAPDILRAELNGKPFTGTIYNLNYPRDFAYKIVETP